METVHSDHVLGAAARSLEMESHWKVAAWAW